MLLGGFTNVLALLKILAEKVKNTELYVADKFFQASETLPFP